MQKAPSGSGRGLVSKREYYAALGCGNQRRQAGRCGATTWRSGRISPVSSQATTPLHSRLQPCSGWLDTTRAASWSGASAEGQVGLCVHIVVLRSVVDSCCVFVVTMSIGLNRREPHGQYG